MTKYLLIITDTNDADYDTIFQKMLYDDQEECVRRVANAVLKMTEQQKGWFHNWPLSEYSDSTPQELYKDLLSEDDIEYFNDMGIHYETHTIKTIKIIDVVGEEVLFD